MSPDFDRLLAQSIEELRLKTQGHDAAWGIGKADWNVDQDQGKIVFTCADVIIATAPVQIIGTYNSEDKTWLWGWDHPSVVPGLEEHAKRVRDYGNKHGIKRLTTRKLACSEEEAWEFTAIACKLGNAQGAYRGPAGTAFVFMTFGEVTLSKSAGPQGSSAKAPASKTPPSIPEGKSPPTNAPAQTVRAFISAYYEWHMALTARIKPLRRASKDYEAVIELAAAEYDDIVSRFCASSVERQGIAFGGNPMHHPELEIIESEAISGENALVQTRKANPNNFVSDYEYHLVLEAGEWRIVSLLYVDEGGKFECL